MEILISVLLSVASLQEDEIHTEPHTNTDQAVTPNDPAVPLKRQDGVLYEKTKDMVKNLIFVNQIDEAFYEMVRYHLPFLYTCVVLLYNLSFVISFFIAGENH